MTHEITSTDHMFAVGATPWHTLGTVLPADRALSTAEALPLAFPRLDGRPGTWDVTSEPARVCLGADNSAQIVPGYKCIIREDTREVLSIQSDSFRELNNAAAFGIFDPYVQDGTIRYETAGSLRGGRRVWILARLRGDLDVGTGDKVATYALLAHGHDGSLAIRCQITGVRVVCANTLAMALWGKGARGIRHTGDVRGKAAAGVAALEGLQESAARTAEKYRRMATAGADLKTLAHYLSAVYQRPIDEVIGRGTDEQGKARTPMRALEPVREFFENQRGGNLATTEGTVWGLYQALTAYATHGGEASKRDPAARLDANAFGQERDRASRGEIVADLLASVGLGRAGLTWEDLQTTSTPDLVKIAAAKTAA